MVRHIHRDIPGKRRHHRWPSLRYPDGADPKFQRSRPHGEPVLVDGPNLARLERQRYLWIRNHLRQLSNVQLHPVRLENPLRAVGVNRHLQRKRGQLLRCKSDLEL